MDKPLSHTAPPPTYDQAVHDVRSSGHAQPPLLPAPVPASTPAPVSAGVHGPVFRGPDIAYVKSAAGIAKIVEAVSVNIA